VAQQAKERISEVAAALPAAARRIIGSLRPTLQHVGVGQQAFIEKVKGLP